MNYHFRFFDQDVRLYSDSTEYFRYFSELYRRFLVDETEATTPVTIDIAVFTTADNHWHRPVLVIDDRVWPLKDAHAIQASMYEYIFFAILARIRSHILIHGAVLSHQDHAVIICGDSQHGKTTLALKLLQQGFDFLSDEIAALGRTDGLVHPFPRRLRIRAGSLSRAGYSEMTNAGRFWLDKSLLDAEQLRPGCLGGPALLRDIILLSDSAGHPDQAKGEAAHGLYLTVNEADEALVSAIGQLDSVSRVEVNNSPLYPTLFIATEERGRVLNQVEILCQHFQVLILGVQKRSLYQPSFEREARVEPVATSQVVLELLGQFQGSHNSSILVDEYGGSSLKLYLEVADLIKDVRCHRLYIGPLEQMAGLVCNVVSDNNSSVATVSY